MKKSFLLLLIPFFTFSQGWFIQTSFSPAQSLQTVRFYDQNTGYTTAPLYNGSNFNIHKTTNAGQNWVSQNSGYTSMRFMAMFMRHPDTVFISGNDGIILRTVNGGSNWVTVYNEPALQLWGMYFVNSFTGFVSGSTGRIMKTTNSGLNWVNVASPTQTSLNSIYFLNENTGWISGYAIALKTTNQGQSWTNLNAPSISPFENFREIYFFSENTGLYVSDAGRVVKTTNGGTNWNVMNSGTTQSLFGVYFINSATGYACGNNGAIIMTTDAGDNWTVQTSPLAEIHTDVWFTSANTGYISTWSGKILKTTNGGITYINPVGTEVPSEYSLEQNYPNPFNPVTKFKFSIPVSGNVILKIYDISGREVSEIVNKPMLSGTYEADWDASAYSSGVYFYKILSGDFSETKKMILMK
ncbi:MAG: peptidase S8/S53 subtilisin kexin sedolisin [Chlorobi bacterium OLB5]|nr:MAG: peptidase S8/S53 subtilisin kexin sedolisin [Chlorobi bacterium OLB5]